MKISSIIKVLDGELHPRTVGEIKNEPMLFNCDAKTAHERGGNLTREFLKLLPIQWQHGAIIIDSRTHMLMKGWYPCIPGWHHDDVPRTRADGQPNYDDDLRAEHIMALVSSNDQPICQTEFALGDAEFVLPPQGITIYERWHEDVELLIANRVLKREAAPQRRLIHFDDRSWHRGTQSTGDGWRWFIRATRYIKAGQYTPRPKPAANELRAQSQVYMPAINAGW